MAEDLKGLIEKIQEEGVKAAEGKARSIELNAKEKASAIVEAARREAGEILSSAKMEAARNEESVNATLKQAGRDLILSIRKEISSMLDKLIAHHIQKALGPDEMARIISSMIKECGRPEKDELVINAKKEDLERLEKALMAELGQKAREGLILRPSDELRGGFMISYDGGRSHFDFSDKALADYISGYLKPRLAQILKD